ncbi:hypothetical protein OH491_23995 [Termitidicoccus mucosus]
MENPSGLLGLRTPALVESELPFSQWVKPASASKPPVAQVVPGRVSALAQPRENPFEVARREALSMLDLSSVSAVVFGTRPLIYWKGEVFGEGDYIVFPKNAAKGGGQSKSSGVAGKSVEKRLSMPSEEAGPERPERPKVLLKRITRDGLVFDVAGEEIIREWPEGLAELFPVALPPSAPVVREE